MNIVTLTSDLGTKDYYLASVKATALKLITDLHWVDISHHVPAFDMAKAAFVLKNVWRDFPAGTFHIVGVDCDWRADSPYDGSANHRCTSRPPETNRARCA